MANGVAPTVAPLEGKTTIDDQMVFEPTRLSYESVKLIAAKIANDVSELVKNKEVVIAGTTLLVDFTNLEALYLLLDGLQRDYSSLTKHADDVVKKRRGVQAFIEGESTLISPAEGGPEVFSPEAARTEAALRFVAPEAILPGVAAAEAALGLVSVFRSDVEYHGVRTSVEPLAFELTLAAKIIAVGANKAFVPDFMVMSSPLNHRGSLRARIEEVQKAKVEVWKTVGPVISELVKLDAQLERAVLAKNQKLVDELSGKISAMRRDTDPVAVSLSRLDQRLADLQTDLNKTDQATGLTLLARLLRAEIIRSQKPVYLHARVVSSGGHNRTSRNLFRMLFMGDGLRFMGGATASWALLSDSGSVEKAGIYTTRESSKFPSAWHDR